MLRFAFSNRIKCSSSIRCSYGMMQRFLASDQTKTKSNKTASLPIGSSLSAAQRPDNLPMIYVPNLFTRIKMKLGLQGDLREPQKILYQAAAISYYMINASVDFDALQRELNMPDVFSSYGKMIFLHVWFLLVRYIQLGQTKLFSLIH